MDFHLKNNIAEKGGSLEDQSTLSFAIHEYFAEFDSEIVKWLRIGD